MKRERADRIDMREKETERMGFGESASEKRSYQWASEIGHV